MEKQETINISRRQFSGVQFRKIDEDTRTVEFVASDNSVDSYGTVLPVDKWDLARYEKNPIVGYQHDVYGDDWLTKADPDDIIGKGRAFIEDDKLVIAITFEPEDVNAKADKIYKKIKFGSLNAVSVGFRPTGQGHMGDAERGENPDVYYYGGMELLEVSVVNIPANANAIKRSIEEEIARSLKDTTIDTEAEQARLERELFDTRKRTLQTIARARLSLAQNL